MQTDPKPTWERLGSLEGQPVYFNPISGDLAIEQDSEYLRELTEDEYQAWQKVSN